MSAFIQDRTILLSLLVAGVLVCFEVLPKALAVVPAPDGGYPGGNTAEGQNALLSLNVNTGTNNAAVGWFSLKSNVDGQLNTAVGAGTLFNNTADRNTAIGGAAMFSNTSGSFNTAIGMLSLFTNSTGSSNTAIGDGALLNNATGSFNTAIGRVALLSNTDGSGNTATGAQALTSNTTGDQNTAYGYQALLDNTTGDGQTAVGFRALSNSTGGNNTAVGGSALANHESAPWNTAVGFGALRNDQTGYANTAIGNLALDSNISGHFNTAIGDLAGVAINGYGNVCIGQGVPGAEDADNTTWIRNVYASVATARQIYVNSDDKIGTLSSSRRYKEEIQAMDKASKALFALKPVTFRYKKEIDRSRALSFGLIAEEVAQISPNLITCDEKGKPQTVRYEAVNAMLLNEFLKEHREVQELKKQVAALAAGLQKLSAQLELSKSAPQVVIKNQ